MEYCQNPVGILDANELAHGAALPNSGYSPKNFIDFPDFARLSAMSRIACWRYLNCRLARTIKKSKFRRDVGWNALGEDTEMVKSDIEIAREADMKPIAEIGAKLGIPEDSSALRSD